MVTLSVVIGLQYRSLAVLVLIAHLPTCLYKYLTVCFFISYPMMATVRTVYAVELLTRADLQYELMVRQGQSSDEATTSVLLLVPREADHRPVDTSVLASITWDATYIKEQAGELLSECYSGRK